MLCPDAALRCAPAQPSTEPLLDPARQPCNIRPTQSPVTPCTALPRSPARPRTVPLCRPARRPRGALSYATAPRLALCGPAPTVQLPGALGLWPPQRSPPAHPTAATSPSEHADAPPAATCGLHRPKGVTVAPLRTGPCPAQGRAPDRPPPLARPRPPATTAPSAAAAQHPRGRRDPRGPRSTHPCQHVPTPPALRLRRPTPRPRHATPLRNAAPRPGASLRAVPLPLHTLPRSLCAAGPPRGSLLSQSRCPPRSQCA